MSDSKFTRGRSRSTEVVVGHTGSAELPDKPSRNAGRRRPRDTGTKAGNRRSFTRSTRSERGNRIHLGNRRGEQECRSVGVGERSRATNFVQRERKVDIVALFYTLTLGFAAGSDRSIQAFLERFFFDKCTVWWSDLLCTVVTVHTLVGRVPPSGKMARLSSVPTVSRRTHRLSFSDMTQPLDVVVSTGK